MNIMRKWWGTGGRPGSFGEGGTPENAQAAEQHLVLGLMHLKKLFSEFSYPSHPLSDAEKEDKLYNMLPLFCKVFGNCAPNDLPEKFGDILIFTQHVSKLMVTEIRRRASNQSTEAASCAIIHFLEIENCEESSNGWMLLSSLNILAGGPPQLIEVMTATSLPSTLVKCLYLFFDLPTNDAVSPNSNEQVDNNPEEFTPTERRILLQKVFVQLLVRLCSHVSPAEELAKKDDLSLLFSAITSWCPQFNCIWRKSAAEVLMTLSRHGLSQPVVGYIHNKGCVALCVENMERGQDLSPLEIVEMFVTVFCFLKDSSDVSQTLLDDFRSVQGYSFLTEFILRLEQDSLTESGEALRNLVLLVSSLSYCGYHELKPSSASINSLFHLPGFSLPSPAGRGASVRNLQAFNVLQSVFLKGTTSLLCSVVLDAMSAVYHADSANYFILEPQSTLSTFAERIHTKPFEVQEKYFQLLEMVVFQLNFVPCKELISLSLLLKAQHSLQSSLTCMNTLLSILKCNAIFKDVYREVGILEVFVNCLTRYHKLLTSPHDELNLNEDVDVKKKLGTLIMEALTHLLSGNVQNTSVFRESGGNKIVTSLVANLESRQQALGLLQQLILASGNDEDMGSILGLLHTAQPTDLQLKTDILKTLLLCLKESHRTRTVFRKVGGFVYLMSVIVGLEGSLGDEPLTLWTTVNHKLILGLLITVFNALTTAMRYEPANAKFFHQEFCPGSLCSTLKMLNCFSSETRISGASESPWKELLSPTGAASSATDINTFHTIFTTPVIDYSPPSDMPISLIRVVQVLQLLYHMALDSFDKPLAPNFCIPHLNRSASQGKLSDSSPGGTKRPSSGLNLAPTPCEPVIVHPGVVVTMLHLLPSINHPNSPSLSAILQLYAAHLLKSLVRSEKNQQVMCEADLGGEILELCSIALLQENHPLHPIVQYIFERLAAQAILPKDLRTFLRLGDPLNCLNLDEIDVSKGENPHRGPVPLTRIKTLVSMTTPKDIRVGPQVFPSFVEFDMSAEGFGCLFLPSIAPQSVGGTSVVTSALTNTEVNVIGGIGSGDRIFPPQTGLTYSTWFCVEKYSDPRTDPHFVRLLTIARHVPGRNPLGCLAVGISARDKALLVSTHESNLPQSGQGVTDWEPEILGDFGCRVWCPDLLSEGQWHHMVLTINRAVLKNSSLSIYIDGQLINQQKLHYILQNPGGGAANLTVASSVYSYIGTPPTYRRHSRLVWRQGPCHLLEDVLQANMVSLLYQLGPHYTGCLQAPRNPGCEASGPIVPEEKIVFGLNATALSYLTLNKIRKVYSKVDNKAIAKQLGMSSHENATPIRILHNSAGHLSGGSRTLGGVVVGYLGVRVFCPRPVAAMVQTVGGCSVLLGLVAMSKDVETLYASVKALSCVVKASKMGQPSTCMSFKEKEKTLSEDLQSQIEMEQTGGYQTLSLLLCKKKLYLNSHILHLCMSLVLAGDSKQVSTNIPNPIAFSDLLCELEVWMDAPVELGRTLLEHFIELGRESSERQNNIIIMRNLNLVGKLVFLLSEQFQKKEMTSVFLTSIAPPSSLSGNPSSQTTTSLIFSLLTILLSCKPRPQDLLQFGQFIVSTLPVSCVSEKNVELRNISERELENDHSSSCAFAKNILLRNKCLELVHTLLYNSNKNTIHLGFCEEVMKVLGLDWVVVFTQGHLHSSTVLIALKMLVALLSNGAILAKFRDASHNGGWLSNAHLANDLRQPQLSGQSIRLACEVKEDVCHVPGFQILTWQISSHTHVPQLYYLLLALLLGHPVKNVQNNTKFDLDSIWTFLFGVPASESSSNLSGRVSLCPEAAIIILAMIRAMLNQEDKGKELPDWLKTYPVTLIQFLRFLYQQNADFLPVFLSPEVLTAFASTLFPYTPSSEPVSLTSPIEEKVISGDIVMVDQDRRLTSHPAKKQVMELLRQLVVDSLSLPPSSKGPQIIDYLLEANPESSSLGQVCEFQTHLLGLLMEHLLDADILIGEGAAIPVLSNGSVQHVAPNVFYLAARIVDKLWTGMFNKDPHEVFDFIIKLISQSKRRASGINLESIYHCLNRTILYLLSRPPDCIATQMSILEALHKLTTHRSIVFGAGNHEQEFVACLTFCLLQLTADLEITTNSKYQTVWHVNPNTPGPVNPSNTQSPLDAEGHIVSSVSKATEMFAKDRAEATATQSHNLMSTAAVRVWEELYITKKPAIEEVFKVSLNVSSGKAPDLSTVRELVYETAIKLWFGFLDGEKKQSYKLPWDMPTQIQSVTNKLQKVTGGFTGLTRLASRSKNRREDSVALRKVNLPMSEVQLATFAHIGIVKDVAFLHFKNLAQKQEELHTYAWKRWQHQEKQLTRERGLWGPVKGSHLDKWTLEATEGPCRMRKKLFRNHNFYQHYPFKATSEFATDNQLRQIKYKMASCFDSQEYMLKRRPEGLCSIDEVEEDVELPQLAPNYEAAAFAGKDVSEMDVTALKGSSSSTLPDVSEEEGEGIDINELTQQEPNSQPGDDTNNPDEQTLHRLLEKGERASHMFRCARIQGLDTIEGLLIFGKEHFYIVDNFTLLRSREIRYIGSLPPGAHEPIIPGSSAPPSQTELVSSKFHYDDVREVHQRRYLLQPIAIEIFASDGRNYLLALPKKHRNKVYQRLMVVCTGLSDNAQNSVEGQRRSASVEQAGGLFSSIIGETSVTHRWVRGEISNFQYLMHLNTLAGRSYNDLMQYPVFPWILADYDSEILDLVNPDTFRDLSKPMGAQTPDRLEQFRKRYREWDDPTGETPPYHYGTHYSSAMIVSSYLVRMEPFTQHFLRLQGGHFDLADRMFHSLKEAWNSAARNNMADVKELIPEFFYLPEFFLNMNKFDLGSKQNGTPLNHVILPQWAKGDPREFIRLHRAALECDFVSSHLHEWIDLIFGNKQRGPPAVDAVNVFHHLFYEGNVDIYSIDDPLKKNATIGFINNFGQIPKQLFKKPHPCKKLGGQRISIIETGPLAQAPSITPKEKVFYHNLDNLRPSMHPIKEVKGAVGQVIGHDKLVLAVEQNKVLIPSTFQRYLAWGFADHSLRIGSYESDRALLVYEKTHPGEVLAAVCPNNKTIVTAGTSTVVTVYEVVRRQLKQKVALYGHSDAVTCLAACSAYGLLVSGSRDRSAIIWDLASLSFVKQLIPHQAPLAAVAINEQTGDIATCAGTWLHLWSINGTPIASVNTALGARSPMQQILCVCFSTLYEWDNSNVIITGSSDGVTRMWSLEYVQVIEAEEEEDLKEGDNESTDLSSGNDSPSDEMKLKVPLPTGATITARRKSSIDSRKLLTANEEFNTGGFLNKCVSESSLSEEECESDPDGSEKEDGELDTFVELKNQIASSKDAVMNIPKSPGLKTPKSPLKEDHLSPKESKEKRLLHRQIALTSTGSGSSLETSHSLDSQNSPNKFSENIHPTGVMRAKSSVESSSTVGLTPGSPPAILPQSKSETNLMDSDNFVLISDADVKEAQGRERECKSAQNSPKAIPPTVKGNANHRNSLLPGMKWAKQLVFRSKLTMHTAFDRQDNVEPASVTAIAVSRDHRTLYVGDTRGRVFSWSVCDQPGKGLADHWQKDDGTDLCTGCGTKFTVYERRHHCRNCGHLYCSKCSRFECEISRLRIFKPVRVCQKCYQQLKLEK